MQIGWKNEKRGSVQTESKRELCCLLISDKIDIKANTVIRDWEGIIYW